jgi:hypothetical protein
MLDGDAQWEVDLTECSAECLAAFEHNSGI